jgi:hypothetical protein
MIYLYKPAFNPFQRVNAPSSATIVLVVPMRPLYFGSLTSFLVDSVASNNYWAASSNSNYVRFYIYNLTFTVSIGMVNVSAIQADIAPYAIPYNSVNILYFLTLVFSMIFECCGTVFCI